MLGLFNLRKGDRVAKEYANIDELYDLDMLDKMVALAVEGCDRVQEMEEVDTEDIGQLYEKLKMVVNSMWGVLDKRKLEIGEQGHAEGPRFC
jgi:hypothetical protein